MKVGDKVRVTRNGRKFVHTPGFANSWVDDMDDAIGEVFTIADIGPTGVYFTTELYGFPPQVLEVVDGQ